MAILLISIVGSAHAWGPDHSFGNKGWVEAGSDSGWPRVEFDRQGRMLVSSNDEKVSLIESIRRLNPDGSEDKSFGIDGLTHVGLNTVGSFQEYGEIADIHVQRDGRILVAGALVRYDEEAFRSSYRMFIARFMPNGKLDRSFGEGGLYVEGRPLGQVFSTATSVFSRPDGMVVVAGSYGRFNRDQAIVLKLNSQGELLEQKGFRITLRTEDEFATAEFSDLIPAAGGGAFVSGRLNERLVAARLDGDGNAVESFGQKGIITLGKSEPLCDSVVRGCSVDTRMVRARGRLFVLTSEVRKSNRITAEFVVLRRDGSKMTAASFRARRAIQNVTSGTFLEATDLTVDRKNRLLTSFAGRKGKKIVTGILALSPSGRNQTLGGASFWRAPTSRIERITGSAIDRSGRLGLVGFDSQRIDYDDGWYEARPLRMGVIEP